MAKVRYASVQLAFFKQGDDLKSHLEETNFNKVQALRNYADQLTDVAKHLRELSSHIEGTSVEVDAQGHHIWLIGPEDNLEKICQKGLAIYDDEDFGDDNLETSYYDDDYYEYENE